MALGNFFNIILWSRGYRRNTKRAVIIKKNHMAMYVLFNLGVLNKKISINHHFTIVAMSSQKTNTVSISQQTFIVNLTIRKIHDTILVFCVWHDPVENTVHEPWPECCGWELLASVIFPSSFPGSSLSQFSSKA